MDNLYILSAGCVLHQVSSTVDQFNATHDDIQAVYSSGGSVKCIQSLKNGEPCDLLISADYALFESMLMPQWADSYYIFAGNSMVLVPSTPGLHINSENWKDVLVNPKTTFGHYDPHIDPGGYRAVMACMLADSVEMGLAKRLLEHPGRIILASSKSEKPDVMFGYRSASLSKGTQFADLPESINLALPAFNKHYTTAVFDIDNDGKNTVHGSAIGHALTIPFTSKNPKAALQFAELFLENDFASQGFLPRKQVVGNWPPER